MTDEKLKKEAEESFKKRYPNNIAINSYYVEGFKDGYNRAKVDIKYDLMMKLKDEGIVKPLKDSIFYNERLSSQEQQELCAWIECAMDFGENLDECSTKLEYAKTIIQDLLNNSDEYARQRAMDFLEKE